MPVIGAGGGAAVPRCTLPEFFGLVTEKIQRRVRELEERAAPPASCPPNGGLPASHPTKPPLVRADAWVAGETPSVTRRGVATDVPTSACTADDVSDNSIRTDAPSSEALENHTKVNVPAGKKADPAKTEDSLTDNVKKAATAKAMLKKKEAPKKKATPRKKKNENHRKYLNEYERACRAAQSEEEKEVQRAKWREYERARRPARSEEERKAANEKHCKYLKVRRATQSEEEKEVQKAKWREYERARRPARSEEEKEAARAKQREYKKTRYATLSKEERAARNAYQRAWRATRSKKQREERAAKKAPPRANKSITVGEKLCAAASEMVTICVGAGIKPDVAPNASSDIRVNLEPGMEEYHCKTDNKDADATENA